MLGLYRGYAAFLRSRTLFQPAFRPLKHARSFRHSYPLSDISNGPGKDSTGETLKLTTNDSDSAAHYSTVERSIYYDNIYPLKWFKWDLRYTLYRPSTEKLMEEAKTDLLPPTLPYKFTIRSVAPRVKDGGLFVRLAINVPSETGLKDATVKGTPTSRAIEDVLKKISSHLRETDSWIGRFNPIRAFEVKGDPFMEDLLATYPTSRLKVEFMGPDVTIETLYKELRVFGRISDITIAPPSKDGLPRYAIVRYGRVRSAAAARNCIHNEVIGSTRLTVNYDIIPKTNIVWAWITGHTKFMIPLLIATVFAIFYAIFDPIRIFFITNHVTRRYNVEETPFYIWLRRHTLARLPWGASKRSDDSESEVIKGWHEREEEMKKLNRWISQPPETFFLLSGPRGCGKSEMVEEVLRSKKYKLKINCQELASTRTDIELVNILAKQVGFFPVLSSVASSSGLAEGVIAATTGAKADLSQASGSQFSKVLECTAIALHNLTRPNEHEFGEQKDIPKDEVGRVHDPNDIPIVIIDNYWIRDLKGSQQQLWDNLAKWAALLVENHIAHVLFVTSTVTAAKPLSKALPTRTLEMITISDASAETAIRFLRKQLNYEENIEIDGLKEAIDVLGGRATDLEVFLQKLRTGSTPEEAIDDQVQRAVVEIRKHAFGDETEEQHHFKWSPIQFWVLAKHLANVDNVLYDNVRFSALYNGDETPLQALEAAEIIQLVHRNGRPYHIRANRPIYRAAFRRLMSDSNLEASMRYLTAKQLFDGAVSGLDKAEKELIELSKVILPQPVLGYSRVPSEIMSRVQYLLNKVKTFQGLIEQYDKDMSAAKKTLELK